MSSPTTERVGRYQLLEPIGVGPSGTVSRAKVFGVAGFERQFAIKRFHAELTATAALAQSLSAAARAYGSLEHPRIARMSEFGVAQGTTFTAVELVAGLDALRLVAEARLAGAALAAGGALALVSQAARAVGYAHGRGLTHLGLAPTNVMVTAEGDIKITDFGILSATLPQRPTDAPRLAQRIPYLAPEQLANEATSAATDVFALGVLAYELVTGQRTFRGETPQQIAQSVMAGPPHEPPLPRPIVRVLQRCLARSPFERFPDARALADALDAALRVAPVPGTRKDIGVLVKQVLDRMSELNESAMSGMVALNVGTGPIRTVGPGAAPARSLGSRDSLGDEPTATGDGLELDEPAPFGPGALLAASRAADNPATTMPDLPRAPMTTVPGLAPPPIPVPPGFATPAIPPPPGIGTSTLLGMTARPPPIPRAATPPPIPRAATPPPIPRAATPSSGSRTVSETTPEPPGFGRAYTPGAPPEPPVLGRGFTPGPGEAPSYGRVSTESVTFRGGADLLAQLAEDSEPPRGADHEPEIELDVMASGPQPVAASGPFELGPPPEPVHRPATPLPALEIDAVPREEEESIKTTGEMEPYISQALRAQSLRSEPVIAPPIGPHVTAHTPPTREPSSSGLFDPIGGPTAVVASLEATAPVQSGPPIHIAPAHAPEPFDDGSEVVTHARAALPPAEPPPPEPQHSVTTRVRPAPSRSRAPMILGATLGALALAGAGWFVYGTIIEDEPATGPVAAAHDAAALDATTADTTQVATAALDAAAPSADAAAPDAAQVAVTVDAVPAPPADAAQVAATTVDAGAAPPPGDNSLTITSTPAGARVFLDGSDAGQTPLKLPGTPDRHTVALLLAGHELYVAQVDGHGAFAIPLKDVTPTGGPAGIKVLKCKDKDRYYVFVDGKPTGQTCPTERIETELGSHVVEVYDVVSETRRKWEIDVKDTRLSYRVRVE